MGLFSEIGRAWLTVDSKLFLWAYDVSERQSHIAQNAQLAADLYVYEDISQIILSVALVPPRPGV